MPSSLITTLRSNLPADIDLAAGLGEGDERNLLHALASVPDPGPGVVCGTGCPVYCRTVAEGGPMAAVNGMRVARQIGMCRGSSSSAEVGDAEVQR